MEQVSKLNSLIWELQKEPEAWIVLISCLLIVWIASFLLYRDLYRHGRVRRAVVLLLISAVSGIGFICNAMYDF